MEYLKSILFQGPRLKKEYLGILIALLLFIIFPQMVRMVDNSAAPIDPGALSAILMAVLAMFIFKLATWWLIRMIWPIFAIYSIYHFETNFKHFTPWQKSIIFLSFYCFLLLGFILILVAIL
ncbi:hypothetical protein [Pedobacter insulae]|uniref:hypothetical protein n=1 Tax=Pedobacter insulae TaxID=414048 RepID=UPI0015A6DDEC|nr:hypothetical protein [Pedobacter insulae]